MAQIPEIVPGVSQKDDNPYAGYQVRYLKVDMDDPAQVGSLENLETTALLGDGKIVVLSYKEFSFQSSFFMIVKYLEQR